MIGLRYKTFSWPQNPEVYQETISREPQYRTSSGVTVFDRMGDLRRIITGSGVFSGEEAYDWFKELMLLAEDGSPGHLEHPVWGIRYCYLTGLELVQEPAENLVRYKFTFTQALTNGEVPK